MFASEKNDRKEGAVERSGEEKNRRDKIRAGENEKTVYWGTAGVAETSRLF